MMRCVECTKDLPSSAFYVSNQSRCKECVKSAVRKNRLERIDYYQAYDRERGSEAHRVEARKLYAQTVAGQIATDRAKRKHSQAHPIAARTRNAVSNAVRDGLLAKQPCFICGSPAEAHHPDYSAPLAVAWLCDQHHKQVHKEHRQRMREGA